MLRESTDENSHRVDRVELLDSVLGEDVHHPRREPTIRNDGDAFLPGFLVESLLLEDDLGVAAEVGEVNARFNSERRQIEIQVVRDRAHHGVGLAHQRQDRFPVADIERGEDETLARIRREKMRQVACVQIGQPDFLHFRVLEQIICARGALQARAKN